MHPFARRPSLVRLNPRVPEPAAIVAPRPRGSRRPHTDGTVAAVRRLIEQSTLTYGEIEKRTGVGRASICRWTRDGGWQRPLFAPRATDTVPTARASAKLKARTLAARLQALAERYIRELEESACVDPEKLTEALELMKMAKLAARPRRGRRPRHAAAPATPESNAAAHAPEHFARGAMRTLRAAGVDTHRVPDDALEDFVACQAPPPARQSRRGPRYTRDDHHAWLLTKIDAKS